LCLRISGAHRAVVLRAGELSDGRFSYLGVAISLPALPRRAGDTAPAERGAGTFVGCPGRLLDDVREIRSAERSRQGRATGLAALFSRQRQHPGDRSSGPEAGRRLWEGERLRVLGSDRCLANLASEITDYAGSDGATEPGVMNARPLQRLHGKAPRAL